MSAGSPGPARTVLGLPPGPKDPVRSTLGFQRNPLAFLDRLNRTYGDISRLRLLTTPTVVLNHPNFVKRILQDNHVNYNKDSPAHKMARSVFGTGLVTSIGGSDWRGKRRLVQPAFHRRRVTALTAVMLDVIDSQLASWERSGEVLDVGGEMARLALAVFTRSLFAIDAGSDALRRFMRAGVVMTEELAAHMRFPLVPLAVPTPGHRRFRANLQTMQEVALDVVRDYRADDRDRGDLLSMMMQATDEETGERMSDEELRDEVIGLLFAGYETSAKVLTWTVYLLARHSAVAGDLRDEVDGELKGDRPTIDDLARLPGVRAVVDETMRLYPPGWQNFRHAVDDDEIGGYRIPGGTQMFWNAYSLHRHPEFWEEPQKFDPGRFRDGHTHERSSYIPFGAGQRICVGNVFALTEMQLSIARIMQLYRFELTTTEPVEPLPSVTLGAARPIHMRVFARS